MLLLALLQLLRHQLQEEQEAVTSKLYMSFFINVFLINAFQVCAAEQTRGWRYV